MYCDVKCIMIPLGNSTQITVLLLYSMSRVFFIKYCCIIVKCALWVDDNNISKIQSIPLSSRGNLPSVTRRLLLFQLTGNSFCKSCKPSFAKVWVSLKCNSNSINWCYKISQYGKFPIIFYRLYFNRLFFL